MRDYFKSTNQKINQLHSEIGNSSATPSEKRNMQHTLEKISIFCNDVFDDANKIDIELKAMKPHFKMRGEIIDNLEEKLKINK